MFELNLMFEGSSGSYIYRVLDGRVPLVNSGVSNG